MDKHLHTLVTAVDAAIVQLRIIKQTIIIMDQEGAFGGKPHVTIVVPPEIDAALKAVPKATPHVTD